MMVKNAKSNVLVPVVLFQMQANALKIAPSDAPKLDLTKAGGSSGPCLKILHSKFPVGLSPGCTAADALAAKEMYILYFCALTDCGSCGRENSQGKFKSSHMLHSLSHDESCICACLVANHSRS